MSECKYCNCANPAFEEFGKCNRCNLPFGFSSTNPTNQLRQAFEKWAWKNQAVDVIDAKVFDEFILPLWRAIDEAQRFYIPCALDYDVACACGLCKAKAEVLEKLKETIK